MRVIGLDAASQFDKFGYAVGNLTSSLGVTSAGVFGKDADACLARIAKILRNEERALVAIDAPLGWPEPMGRCLAQHAAGQHIPTTKEALFRRQTDSFVRQRYKKNPLEVGADRIARAAHHALEVLGRLRELSGKKIPLSVIVRDDAGAPLAGYQVAFFYDTASPASVMFLSNLGGTFTDANGRAAVQMVAWGDAGDVVLRVEAIQNWTTQATLQLPPLTVVGLPPAQVSRVSGTDQTAYVDSLFGQDFAVQVLDANGVPIPYAFVEYEDAGLPGWAYSTFAGAQYEPFYIMVMADANGVARARATAGPVLGNGIVGACAVMTGPCTNFWYTVVARPILTSATPWQIPPLSQERGTSSVASFVMTLRDQYGQPFPGAQVTYVTDPACGSFLGSPSATVTADDIGRAISPPFTALSSEVYCRVALDVSPTSRWAWDIYEFSADHVVIGDLPASLSIGPRQSFTLAPTFTADGVGIYPLPISIDVTPAPNGATATLLNEPFASFDYNRVYLTFIGNEKTGNKYTVTVRRGPVQATVEVKQSGR